MVTKKRVFFLYDDARVDVFTMCISLMRIRANDTDKAPHSFHYTHSEKQGWLRW